MVSFNVIDEKEKFEPTVFRDTIVAGLNEAGSDLEAVAKFLDVTGSRLDYRRYAETLFDILITGSMLGECHWDAWLAVGIFFGLACLIISMGKADLD